MNMVNRSWMAAVVVAGGLMLSGCSDDQDSRSSAAAAAAKSSPESNLLAYVPDSTPYVVANTRQLDTETLDLMWSLAEPTLKEFDQVITKELERMANKANPDDGDRLGQAVLGELSGKMSRQGLAELGLDSAGSFAIYGQGVLPVARLQISDPQTLNATIARIEANSGKSFPKQSLGGVDYYEGGDHEGVFIASIQQDHLVLAILPTQVKDAMLPQVLGLEKPAQSIAESGRLEQANEEFGLLPWGTLLVDSVRFMDLVFSDESEAARALFAKERVDLTPQCVAEYRELAGVMPRIVSGYTSISETEVQQYGLFELRSDIAAGLSVIKAAIPGLDDIQDSMFYFAMGMDLLKAKEITAQQMAAVRADPYQCEGLAQINADAERADLQINQPLPPFVANIRGLRLNVTEADIGGANPSAKGQAMVAMNNPQLVLGMAQAFVPQLAELKIGMDGEPVALPAGLSPVPLEAPHVAMVDAGIGFSIGEGQQNDLKSFLTADTSSDAPFISVGYDAAAIAAYQKSIMSLVEDGDGTTIDPTAGLDRLSRSTATFDLTSRGIEVVGSTYLKP
jgi:hypothetical protein